MSNEVGVPTKEQIEQRASRIVSGPWLRSGQRTRGLVCRRNEPYARNRSSKTYHRASKCRKLRPPRLAALGEPENRTQPRDEGDFFPMIIAVAATVLPVGYK